MEKAIQFVKIRFTLCNENATIIVTYVQQVDKEVAI